MPHLHDIYDSDDHFIITPATRTISTESTKLVLGWQDHNSERYTFEIPRFVEGHDMLECNEVQIHFDNVSSNKRTTNSDYYTVTDLQVSPASDDVVIFSWLISGSATQLVGKLSFSIHFACVSDDGEREYSWHTTTFEGISILKGIHNTKALVEEYSDFVSRIESIVKDSLDSINACRTALDEAVEIVHEADSKAETAINLAEGATEVAQSAQSSVVTSYNDLTDKPAIQAFADESLKQTLSGTVAFADLNATAIMQFSYWTGTVESSSLPKMMAYAEVGLWRGENPQGANGVVAPALLIAGNIKYGRRNVTIFDGAGQVWKGSYNLQNNTWASGPTLVSGNQGPPGETGATPNLQIGTVTTLDAGSNATATITGTAENPLLNLGVPKGADGSQGEPGVDGQTLYVWIKYADDVTGSGMSNDPTDKEYIGIAYNKMTDEASTNANDYTWLLIKGPQGDKGDPGVTGEQGNPGPAGASAYDMAVSSGYSGPETEFAESLVRAGTMTLGYDEEGYVAVFEVEGDQE